MNWKMALLSTAVALAGCSDLSIENRLAGKWDCGGTYSVAFEKDGTYRVESKAVSPVQQWAGTFTVNQAEKGGHDLKWTGDNHPLSSYILIDGPRHGQLLLSSTNQLDKRMCVR